MISWKSKKQPTISRSSADAEYRSITSTIAEVTWLIGLLQELDIPISLPVAIYCDNTAAIQIASNLVFHKRTKHIDIDCHFIREKIQGGSPSIKHLSTTEQPADVLTKGLG